MIEYVHIDEENFGEALVVSNRNLTYDVVSAETFRHVTFDDPDFDSGMTWLAMDNGEACGVMVGVCRQTDDGVSAAVKFFAVDETHRDKRVASEMLSRTESAASARGATSLGVGFTRPNYLFPGVDPRYTVATAFLLRRGFEHKGSAFNMDVELDASDWSTDELETRLAKDNIICRRLRPEERERLRDWMAADGFSASWEYQVIRASHADPVAVFVAEKDGEIMAFSCYDGVRPGWFGPMATSKRLRGGGVGTLTFLKCLQSMKGVGYKVCEINSVGPLYFYSKAANAIVSRIWWQFYKDLA